MDDTIYPWRCGLCALRRVRLELRLNSHENECAVYLEPDVLQNLIEFWKSKTAK